MKQVFRIFLIGVLAVSVFAINVFSIEARAEKLSGEDVTKFVKALPDIQTFTEKLQKEGKDKVLNVAVQPTPGDKNYSPYVKGTEVMKEKLPGEYKELGDIAGKHGFKSQEDWAKAGDSVMLAYMAVKLDAENPGALKNIKAIPEDQKAKMDAPMRARLEQTVTMLEIFTSAPESDRAAVKPHMKEIDAWLERSKTAEAGNKKPAEAPAAAPEKKKSAE